MNLHPMYDNRRFKFEHDQSETLQFKDWNVANTAKIVMRYIIPLQK